MQKIVHWINDSFLKKGLHGMVGSVNVFKQIL